MTEQLVAGATIYKKRNSSREWLLVKKDSKDDWELPKGLVKRGESSVSSVLRTIRENVGLTVQIIEEAGRTIVPKVKNGQRLTDKIIFYLGERISIFPLEPTYAQERWLPYSRARRLLGLGREKKILEQANDVLKECLRAKRRNRL